MIAFCAYNSTGSDLRMVATAVTHRAIPCVQFSSERSPSSPKSGVFALVEVSACRCAHAGRLLPLWGHRGHGRSCRRLAPVANDARQTSLASFASGLHDEIGHAYRLGVAMRRRDFIKIIGGAAALPLSSRAQQSDRALRIGVASVQPRSVSFWRAFEQRMAELGYQEGKNYTLEYLNLPSIDLYESSFRKIVASGPDVILATGPEIALKSAIASSATIPIVMVAIDFDPFAGGYVTSLAKPTGNVTGLFLQQIELTAKRLQFLKSEFPDIKEVTVFWDRITAEQWGEAQRAGSALGLRLSGIEFRDPPYDYEKALTQVAEQDRGTLLALVSPFFFRDRQRLAELALRQRMVSMFGFREWVEAGGLMSYGPGINGMYRRAADYVDRIARGAKPGDLPIEQPTKFELVINLKTAKALGLTMPATLLARADEAIE